MAQAHPAQSDLFNEADTELEQVEPAPETEKISTPRKKTVRRKLPTDFPREVIMHDLP